MDEIDGGSEIDRLPLDMSLRTVITAMHTAISMQAWDIAADAMVMIQQIELRYRPADEKSKGVFMLEKQP